MLGVSADTPGLGGWTPGLIPGLEVSIKRCAGDSSEPNWRTNNAKGGSGDGSQTSAQRNRLVRRAHQSRQARLAYQYSSWRRTSIRHQALPRWHDTTFDHVPSCQSSRPYQGSCERQPQPQTETVS